MKHFAHITNGTVDRVIVISEEMLNTGNWGDPSEWVETDPDTCEGEHKGGGTPLRKNYAGVGYTYDAQRDAFIPPKISETFSVFNEQRGVWEHPTAKLPRDGKEYRWDESTDSWKATNLPKTDVTRN